MKPIVARRAPAILAIALLVCAVHCLDANAYDGERIASPPTKTSTTLNIDGDPVSISIFGRSYRGIAITHIGPKGIAEVIGISPEDVLLSLNTQTVVTAQQADSVLRSCPSGDLEIAFARRTAGGYKLMEKVVNYINPLVEFSSMSRQAVVRDTGDLEDQLLDLINADRSHFAPRAPHMQKSKLLADFARSYAQEMVKRNFFSHTDPDGNDFEKRADARGINFLSAENLASGARNAADAESMFMSEPDGVPGNHRFNILNPSYLYAGVGVARKPDDSLLVVEEFATFSPDQQSPADTLNRLDAPPGLPGGPAPPSGQ